MNAFAKKWNLCKVVGFWKKYRIFVFCFSLLILGLSGFRVWAFEELKGHAKLTFIHKKHSYQGDQVVYVKPGLAVFETLDDFGNTLLRYQFTGFKSKNLPRWLKISLTQTELTEALLLNDLSQLGWKQHSERSWIKVKGNKIKAQIDWGPARLVNKKNYVESITIKTGKTTMILNWVHIVNLK